MNECSLGNINDMAQGMPVQRQIISSTMMTVRPTIMSESVIEFDIKNESSYTDLSKTEVECKFRVTKGDNSNLTAGDKTGPVNYMVASLFSNVEIKLNGVVITNGSSNYAERANMELLTSYGRDAAESWLKGGGFVKDTAGKMDEADPTAADPNLGLKARSEYTKLSKLVTVRGKVHEDIFNQPRLLPNKSRLYIKFTRNKDAYCLMASENNAEYKIKIEEMSLLLHTVTVSDEVQRENARKDTVLPITRVIQKEFTVTQGGRTFTENSLHGGVIPARIVFGLVSHAAHVGSYNLNPFNWMAADLHQVKLMCDGQVVNGHPLTVNFDKDDVMDGFWSLQRATNTRYSNAGSLIKLDDYKGGYALWAYDLSATQCDEQFIDPRKEGHLSLELEFAKDLAAPLTLCVYMQFDNQIIINPYGVTTLVY